jgi:hypothetical protein
MNEPDYTPKDIFDEMSLERGEKESVARRNVLRKEFGKRMQNEHFERVAKHFRDKSFDKEVQQRVAQMKRNFENVFINT